MDEVVSKFIVSTCRVFPKPQNKVFWSILENFSNPDQYYPIECGSTAEFYIQPLYPCIGDTDHLKVRTYYLAFTDEKQALPYDVRDITDSTNCFLIEPYNDHPSFIRLRHFGELRYDWENKIFKFIPANVRVLLETPNFLESELLQNNECFSTTGPAIKFQGFSSSDSVESIWCPQWPLQAQHWPFRRRKYGWPSTAIIQEVVRNGCHVVFGKHPSCINDIHQCRLSFSVAEVILLQNWTPVQQIVYHMLRFFAKRKLIKKDCPKEEEVLCTYHFKTLMLWSCEEMSPEWWNFSSVIDLCCNLFKKLVKWLKQKTCPHYFVPRANLFHAHMNQKIIDETAIRLVTFFDAKVLSLWFVKHYMQPILFCVCDSRNTFEVLKCVYDTSEIMESMKLISIDKYLSRRFFSACVCLCSAEREGLSRPRPFTATKFELRICASVLYQLNEFMPSAVIEPCFEFFASMLIILHTIHVIDCAKMQFNTAWFVDIFRQISLKPKLVSSSRHNLPKPREIVLHTSQYHFIRATDLMENLTGSNDDPESRIVSLISKDLLREAVECADSRTKPVFIASLTYMAALHFAALEYQSSIDICSLILRSRTTKEEEKEPLNAGCLFFLDDIVRIIGFYLLFRQIKHNLHYGRRLFLLDLRITPKVFAQYLIISSSERTHRPLRLNDDFRTPKFLLDELLMTLINWKPGISNRTHMHQTIDVIEKFEAPTDELTELLMEYSLGNMNSFYSEIYKHFGIHCYAVDCYRAAYLYKCRKYLEVLNLCERILDEPDLQSDFKVLAFANVMVLPPLDSYFDRGIQCLLGFHTLVYYLSPQNKDLQNIQKTPWSSFEHFFARESYYLKLMLSAVLTYVYPTNCHYFLGRHFLARYLKVRCLIDGCHSLSETMLEFQKLKANLPFEHIIRRFLQRKLRQFQKGFS